MSDTSNEISPSGDSIQFLFNKDIVIVSLAEWDGPKRIRQYLTEELERRGNRVLFVEAYYTLSKFIKAPRVKKLVRFLYPPESIRPGLYRLLTFPFIPFGEFSALISKFNWSVQKFFIRRAMRQLGFRNVILWVFAYNAEALVGTLNERLSIYFCNDAFSKLVQSKALQRRVADLERALLRKVDIVFTVSEKLTEEKALIHDNVHTIYHGVDFSVFEETLRNKKSDRPHDLPKKKPIIGYSGVIRYMIDLEMIDYLARKRPDWSFVFVGPIRESNQEFYLRVDQLRIRPNIHFLGPKRPEELPRYINEFDLCLLPYEQTEVSTYYAAPLKFYEYLAAGKAVVSTVGPRDYDDDIVITVTSKEEMLNAIEAMLKKNSRAQVKRRKGIAKQNSWAHRMDAIDTALQQLTTVRNWTH